jgi:geranylgeranyl diphosphate synthase, type I
MLRYHMGWEGAGAGKKAQGKRIRPLLVLLSAIATGSNWNDFLPVAASVELIHNFSLIHDDIEDSSELRRGRETAWKKWGIPQAINAGDLLFTIAHTSLIKHSTALSDAEILEAAKLLHQTCIRLTQGQFLDMDFENREIVPVEKYWLMIEGKTAALMSCSAELGALKADPVTRQLFGEFGRSIGLAFQIQDDILGLWGETAATGKSSDSDLISKKKTLPILYALQNNETFAHQWINGITSEQEAGEAAELLRSDGTYEYTRDLVEKFTQDAVKKLKLTNLDNDAFHALLMLTDQLVARDQ